jgi:hypothetical protein
VTGQLALFAYGFVKEPSARVRFKPVVDQPRLLLTSADGLTARVSMLRDRGFSVERVAERMTLAKLRDVAIAVGGSATYRLHVRHWPGGLRAEVCVEAERRIQRPLSFNIVPIHDWQQWL